MDKDTSILQPVPLRHVRASHGQESADNGRQQTHVKFRCLLEYAVNPQADGGNSLFAAGLDDRRDMDV